MKKIFLCGLVAACCGHQIKAQEMNAVYNKKDSAALIKQTVFNTARFLRFEQPSLTFNGGGYGVDIPGLTYTFTLTKNTVIQISETVKFSTTECDVPCTLLNGGNQEPWFKNSIVIDREKFATFDYIGKNLKSGTSGGTVLAQLGPGTHTIKIHVGINENSGDATIWGFDKSMGNRTFMSLLFFEQ
jgi:hypothetical protein